MPLHEERIYFKVEVTDDGQPIKVACNNGMEFILELGEKLSKNILIYQISSKIENLEIKDVSISTDKEKKLFAATSYFSWMNYDKERKGFYLSTPTIDRCIHHVSMTISYLVTKVEFKHRAVDYNLGIIKEKLRNLNVCEFMEESFWVMNKSEKHEFVYFIERKDEKFFEVRILNPNGIEINGITNDYIYQIILQPLEPLVYQDVFIPLRFLFQNHDEMPKILPKEGITEKHDHTTLLNPTLYEIMSDTQFSDVILISVEKKEVLTHRNLLGKMSTVFEKIFKTSKELPVKINIDKFNAETIKIALEYCYGKKVITFENALALLNFGIEYDIAKLNETASDFLCEKIDVSNVCDFAETAYANNLEQLKKKCIKVLVAERPNIDGVKLKNLSKEILLDLFVQQESS